LLKLKKSSQEEVQSLLDNIVIIDDTVTLLSPAAQLPPSDVSLRIAQKAPSQDVANQESQHGVLENDNMLSPSGTDLTSPVDVSSFLSFDEQGKPHAFGPASSLQKANPPKTQQRLPRENVQHQLIASAALQRQQEYKLGLMPDIDGVDTELATHLLELHWNRQHHTFLLTYRPAFIRDLICGGPYASKFLLNAIFSTASKYSERSELNPPNAQSGKRFFDRCEDLIAEGLLYAHSELPTVAGLLLLGSTLIALGDVSKGWMYSGTAFRMLFDLGLHIEHDQSNYSEEELEIRRRLFWGAFICDKLQSLYTGRPACIDLRHCSVSRDFLDTFEEQELWSPYVDFKAPQSSRLQWLPIPTRSISAFSQLCSLAGLMAKVFDLIYVIEPHKSITKSKLAQVDNGLQDWLSMLPSSLRYTPWEDGVEATARQATPNVLNLNAMYYALIILRHRPFLSDGHLRSLYHPVDSWKKCTDAASSISGIISSYRDYHSLRRAPYMLSYAAYVACTIHVRNAVAGNMQSQALALLSTTLDALENLTVPNHGVRVPLNIIRDLMRKCGLDPGMGRCY
jgi:hypothetical protein